ncbi:MULTISPECIES: dTDP-4-dehydrorhamnose reductase [unclassified Dyella]|uniref:dTDP-4-dehydrorhamnose reductase n=1 Tax=unclassified Dyella TaxID=2634549 RepID=UPI000C833467|nr:MULTISPECIES: dTDP-4-dehydrorhamnose reductase [unclassified Dyella]MDR3444408.1 dTDP-4-dehydrorhamnose reductase [Dyella sp.]PMQ06009.1 dTDP-4-dehydrorhamnose reductase [Dyella sp. AD56]
MRILLLGANGQLGQEFFRTNGLSALGSLTMASRDGRGIDGSPAIRIDLAEPESLKRGLDDIRPEIIINAAAYTAVDKAENNEALATQVNGEAVGAIADWAKHHDALVVHYSTDYVFDGKASRPISPDSVTAPINAYGRSKLDGEERLRRSGSHHLLFRTGWVYSAHGNNFLRTMLKLGAEREVLRIVSDQRGAPTNTRLIVAGTLAALQQWLSAAPAVRAAMEGTYHLVSSGETTWFDYATAIFELAHNQGILARTPLLEAVSTKDFPATARRPAYSVLDNRDFQRQFAFTLPPWQDDLEPVLREIALNGQN